MLSLSANGDKDGILWAAIHATGDSWNESRPGVLHAYDADDINHELWNSLENPGRDDCNNYSKMAPPTVANGKVYLASFGTKNIGTGQMCVYGLLPDGPSTGCAGKSTSLNQPSVRFADVESCAGSHNVYAGEHTRGYPAHRCIRIDAAELHRSCGKQGNNGVHRDGGQREWSKRTFRAGHSDDNAGSPQSACPCLNSSGYRIGRGHHKLVTRLKDEPALLKQPTFRIATRYYGAMFCDDRSMRSSCIPASARFLQEHMQPADLSAIRYQAF